MSTFTSPRSNSYNPKPNEIANKGTQRRLTPNQYSSSNINGTKILRDSQVSHVSATNLRQQLTSFKKGLEGSGKNYDTNFKGTLRSYPTSMRVNTEKSYLSNKVSTVVKAQCPSPNILLHKAKKNPVIVKKESSEHKIKPASVTSFKTEEAERKDDGRWKFSVTNDQMMEAMKQLNAPLKIQELKFNNKDTNNSSDSESSSEASSDDKEFDFNKDIRNIFKINVPIEPDQSMSVDETAVSNADEKVEVSIIDTKEKQFIQNLRR